MSSKAACLLFIVSAPSGTGKTTVVERLVKVTDRLKLSRSYTSRAPRGDEEDGVDYNFVSRARFEEMIAAGEFLEWADVFGNLYGTARRRHATVPRKRRRRRARDRRAGRAEGAGSRASARRDLRAAAVVRGARAAASRPQQGQRRGDSAAAARWRARKCRRSSEYDYVVINDEFEACVERLKAIVLAERSKLRLHAARRRWRS